MWETSPKPELGESPGSPGEGNSYPLIEEASAAYGYILSSELILREPLVGSGGRRSRRDSCCRKMHGSLPRNRKKMEVQWNLQSMNLVPSSHVLVPELTWCPWHWANLWNLLKKSCRNLWRVRATEASPGSCSDTLVWGESQKGRSLWEGLDVGRGAAEIKAHKSEPNWRRGWSGVGGVGCYSVCCLRALELGCRLTTYQLWLWVVT